MAINFELLEYAGYDHAGSAQFIGQLLVRYFNRISLPGGYARMEVFQNALVNVIKSYTFKSI